MLVGSERGRVAVLGGGFQGVCCALELARRGWDVRLIEKRPDVLTQAGIQNEGKLHLGFIFSNDTSFRSAETMLHGALSFARHLRRWLDDGIDQLGASTPFRYGVHRDSLVSADELEARYRKITGLARTLADGGSVDLFGSDPREDVRRLSDSVAGEDFDPATLSAVFATPEIAIDPEALGDLLRARVRAEPRITVVTDCRAETVEPGPDRVAVCVSMDGRTDTESFDHVLNCTWEDIVRLDQTAGLERSTPWMFRIKHFLRVTAAEGATGRMPSASFVLGPFGDVVNYGGGALLLSWYPAGRLGKSSDVSPPPWPRVLESGDAETLARDILDGLGRLMPTLAQDAEALLPHARQRGGIIFASGDTDVDDPASKLHERHAVGRRSAGRYHSIDNGKWVLGPMFAVETADHLDGIAR
jgi:glycine/D-amino acid oxidase-like deaminating enzyme